MTKDVSIPFILWRAARPRFVPSPTLRKEGHKGHDLRHEDGRWFSRGECIDWSDAFHARIKNDRLAADAKRAEERKAEQKKQERIRQRAAILEPAAAPIARPAAPPSPGTYPICQLWHDWLNSPRRSLLQERTIKNYRELGRVLEEHNADLWRSEVTALDQPICNGLYEELWSERGHATANNVLTALGVAIGWGMLKGKVRGLAYNPAHKLRKPTLPPRCRFGTREEIETMIEVADALKLFEIGDAITLGVWMGQRQGDRLAMTSASMLGNVTPLQQGKTGAIVAIPAAPILKARMDAALERRRIASKVSDHVILDEETWTPFTGNPFKYRKLFATVRTVAGRKVESVKTLQDKDLRATCVTWLALADCTIPQIASITGHTFDSVNTILKHYLALHPEMAKSAIGKLVEWYDAGGKTELAI